VDPGLVRALCRHRGPVGEQEKGALFEGLVFTLLRAYGAERGLFDDVFYWAPAEATQVEVDFLLRRGDDLLAIEAKYRTHLQAGATRGLDAIGDLKGVRRRILVYGGTRRMKTQNGIDVLPVRAFVEALAEGRLWGR
jgi:predicted AAA+ superfamily ATPase